MDILRQLIPLAVIAMKWEFLLVSVEVIFQKDWGGPLLFADLLTLLLTFLPRQFPYVNAAVALCEVAVLSYATIITGQPVFLYMFSTIAISQFLLRCLPAVYTTLIGATTSCALIQAMLPSLTPMGALLFNVLVCFIMIAGTKYLVHEQKILDKALRRVNKLAEEKADLEAKNASSTRIGRQEAGKYYTLMDRLKLGYDKKENFERICTTVQETTQATAVSFYIWSDVDQLLQLECYTGDNSIVMPANTLRAGEAIPGSRYYNRTPHIYTLDDTTTQMGKPINTVFTTPFFMGDDTFLGVLSVGFDGTGEELNEKINLCYLIVKHVTPELEKTELYDRTQRLATTDGLTGLFNRRFFDNRLPLEVERAGQFTIPLSLIQIDVDYFKQINDTHGHPEGDKVLITLSEILSHSIRTNDSAFRTGGDEFCVLLPGADIAVAERIANEIETSFSSLGFKGKMKDTGEEVKSTLSIGVSTFPHCATTATDLLSTADQAQYKVKSHGKGHVLVADRLIHKKPGKPIKSFI